MVGRFPELRDRWVGTGLALVLALVTAGCAAYTGPRYGGADAPLRARLASTFELSSRSPTLHFAVSDRAHVALFRVSPSGYVRALYPYDPSGSPRFEAGPHTVFSSTPALGGSRLAPGFRVPFAAHARSPHGIGRPELNFVLLVASRAPLRMDRIRDEVPFRFRRAHALASPLQGGSAFGTMDRLLDRLIPAGLPSDDWAVDWIYTSVGIPRSSLFLRRIAVARSHHPDADTASESTDDAPEPRLLDPGDLPFEPPRVPVDLPEVELPSDSRDLTDRDPAVSDHFGRLFDDHRRRAEGWIPGAGRRGAGFRDRSGREWTEQLEEWARSPETHAFPDPPRPPRRWRGPDRWRRPGTSGSPGHPGAIGHDGTRGRSPDVSVPRTPRGGEIEIDRPSSVESGGGSGSRSSGDGGDDGGDGGTRH